MEYNYQILLAEIKATIQAERTKAARQITRSLIDAYWEIGRKILESQKIHAWGKSIVEQLSKDLQRDFPGTEGFSAINLWNMRLFYERYRESPILQRLVAEIPWGHNLVIMSKAKTDKKREYYIRASSAMGWSRDVLLNQIKANAYHCLIAIDLKIGSFKPEYAGKMNFHLELLDEQAKMPGENASIGIILCAEKENLEVEYALRTSTKPMGVAEYQLSPVLPEGLSGVLPSPEEIKRRIQG